MNCWPYLFNLWWGPKIHHPNKRQATISNMAAMLWWHPNKLQSYQKPLWIQKWSESTHPTKSSKCLIHLWYPSSLSGQTQPSDFTVIQNSQWVHVTPSIPVRPAPAFLAVDCACTFFPQRVVPRLLFTYSHVCSFIHHYSLCFNHPNYFPLHYYYYDKPIAFGIFRWWLCFSQTFYCVDNYMDYTDWT